MKHLTIIAVIVLAFLAFALAGVAIRIKSPEPAGDITTLQVTEDSAIAIEAQVTSLRSFSELGLPMRRVPIAGERFSLAVARENAERSAGLSGVSSMQYGDGMLFEFDRSATHGFWMKGMQFPLDIIWLDGEGRVVHIEEQLSPDTFPETFYPDLPADYVIELNAGVVRDIGLSVGDVVPVDGIEAAPMEEVE